MRKVAFALLLAGSSSVAWAQAIQSFSGGTQFSSYYGSNAGDTVGWRFTVNQDIYVTDLGIWNKDTDGLTSNHDLGLWDSSGALLAAVNVGPGGAIFGDWTYGSVGQILLTVGNEYTVGAVYTAVDSDNYISGASSITTSADVNWVESAYPAAAEMGFAFPELDSTSRGRFGPNFLYVPVPAPGAIAMLGIAGLAASRRRR